MRRAGVVLLAAIVVPSGALLTAPAGAAPGLRPAAVTAPVVGECYDLSDARIEVGTLAGATAAGSEGYWSDVDPVPCTEPHTFEVTESAQLPMDVNAFEFAAQQCGALDVWNAVGVNRPVAGIVEDPLRIEPRAYAVRQSPPSYVCGAVAVELDGRRPPRAVPLTSAIERLTRRERASLRYCSSAADGRGALAPAVTVPCSSQAALAGAVVGDVDRVLRRLPRPGRAAGAGDRPVRSRRGRVAADRRLVGGRDAEHLVLPQVSVMS